MVWGGREGGRRRWTEHGGEVERRQGGSGEGMTTRWGGLASQGLDEAIKKVGVAGAKLWRRIEGRRR